MHVQIWYGLYGHLETVACDTSFLTSERYAQRAAKGRAEGASQRPEGANLSEYKWTSRIRSAAKPHGIECAKIEFRSI
jgi:hypothetical protein